MRQPKHLVVVASLLAASGCRTVITYVDDDVVTDTVRADASTDSSNPPADGADVTPPPADARDAATPDGADAAGQGEAGPDAPPTGPITLREIQDPGASRHPVQNSVVPTIDTTNLVVLAPAIVVSGATASSCRYGMWIGLAGGGDYSGVQLQEIINNPTSTQCFNLTPTRLLRTIAIGTPVTALGSVTFSDFCSAATGADAGNCEQFKQTQLVLRSDSTITFGSAGGPPTANPVTVAQIGQTATDIGSRALVFEGALVHVGMVGLHARQETSGSSTFTVAELADPSDTAFARTVRIGTSNVTRASCIRQALLDRNNGSLTGVTGVLRPNFGLWEIYIRNDQDVEGINCGPDAGAGDAAVDSTSPADAGMDAAVTD